MRRRLSCGIGCFLSVILMCLVLIEWRMAAGEPDFDWQEGKGFRSATLKHPGTGASGFRNLDSTVTGIAFTNHLAEESAALNRIYENGSGVALGDVDGDGWCDIYFCRLEGSNVLYRNLGDMRFEDVTVSSGVACAGQYSTGALLADVDGDGDLDLLVNAIGRGTRLFLNDGKANFRESLESGLAPKFGATSMAMADMDGDGDLDLYVCNYRTTTYKDGFDGVRPEVKMADGKPQVLPADRFSAVLAKGGRGVVVNELGEYDLLYINKGGGRFGPVSWKAGAFASDSGQALSQPPLDWGLSVAFRDLDGDLHPDIYVCNDFILSTDKLWMNEGGKRFRAAPRFKVRCMSMSSMGIDFADINRDGLDDFLVVDMLSRDPGARQRQRANFMRGGVEPHLEDPEFQPEVFRNTLFLNRGDGTYAEIAFLSGLSATEWSWTPVFLDVDLDGYEDLLVATGNARDVLDADTLKATRGADGRGDAAGGALENLRRFPKLQKTSLAFRNQGDLTFLDKSSDWGFHGAGISHGMALGDLDHDGDMDLVVNNFNAAAGIYRNDCTGPRVRIRLRGLPGNTRGIGAKVRVLNGALASQSQEMMSGGRYLSCDEVGRVFAGHPDGRPMTVEVAWRSGRVSRIEGVLANRLYEIDEASGSPLVPTNKPADAALFFDASHLIQHVHKDELFDDFERQPFLSRKLSQLGPGVAWFDVDADGFEDLVVGSGKGGWLAVFRNTGQGGFSEWNRPEIAQPTTRDHTGIVGLDLGRGFRGVLTGVSHYEDGSAESPAARGFDLGKNTFFVLAPGSASTTGPLTAGDVDGDGDLDLFLGGRVGPGRYPEAADSRLLINNNGVWKENSTGGASLKSLGLVSGAVFTDLDADGLPELVLACEWGSPRVFTWKDGQINDVTAAFGIEGLKGWWNSVQAGDFDGDGRMDLVLGNWGRNTRYQASESAPVSVFYGDSDGDGKLEVLETFWDASKGHRAPWRDYELFGRQLPGLTERIPSFRVFSEASIEQILGEQMKSFKVLEASILDSVVLLNRGSKFEVKPLPVEAQFAPVFGLAVADFDGDGREDLALSQNFFDVEVESSRHDAGMGLVLRGLGDGRFEPMTPQGSGLRVEGEQRGCAVADFDQDGRTDLVVGQNRGATRLFRNVSGAVGLRIKLRGGESNPQAVGAVVRLRSAKASGPAREIHAGGGYWSQDASTQVVALPGQAAVLEVRWPGGRLTESPVPAGAAEVLIDTTGRVIQTK